MNNKEITQARLIALKNILSRIEVVPLSAKKTNQRKSQANNKLRMNHYGRILLAIREIEDSSYHQSLLEQIVELNNDSPESFDKSFNQWIESRSSMEKLQKVTIDVTRLLEMFGYKSPKYNDLVSVDLIQKAVGTEDTGEAIRRVFLGLSVIDLKGKDIFQITDKERYEPMLRFIQERLPYIHKPRKKDDRVIVSIDIPAWQLMILANYSHTNYWTYNDDMDFLVYQILKHYLRLTKLPEKVA